MEITREELEARRAALLSEHYRLVGHLEEVDFWIERAKGTAGAEAPADPPPEPPKEDS